MSSENKNGKVPLISKIAYGFGDVGWGFLHPAFHGLNTNVLTFNLCHC